MRDLTYPTSTVRTRAASRLEVLVGDQPALLRYADLQGALIAALEFENGLAARNAAAVLQGAPPLFQEGYGEHYARILGLADRLRGEPNLTGNRRAALRRALVLGSYNGDSPFARDLAEEGSAIAPYVLEATKSPLGPTRWNGLDLIALLLSRGESAQLQNPLAVDSRRSLQAAARIALQDLAPDVRRHAVRAVVAGGDLDAIPVLRFLAETDPDSRGQWSVRALAAEGARRLQQGR